MTVIVPAFNSEATIDACLAAIRGSTYRNYELIVVDDGSRDDTAWIAARHADKVVRFHVNRGSAEARNQGIRVSRGDIIVNIDSDVVVRPDTLTIIRDFFDSRHEVDAISGLLAVEHPHPEFFSQYKNLYMHYIFSRLPESVTFLYGSTHALRRESAGLFYDVDVARADDTALGQKLISHGKTIALVKQLEVVHLKKYDWWSLVKNDFSIPFDWGRIFVKYQGWKQLGQKGGGYAHARPEQLASLMLAPALALLSASTMAGHCRFVYLVLVGAVWFLLNRTFVVFLSQARGFAFGACSIPITFLDQIVMAAGVAAGMMTGVWTTVANVVGRRFGSRARLAGAGPAAVNEARHRPIANSQRTGKIETRIEN